MKEKIFIPDRKSIFYVNLLTSINKRKEWMDMANQKDGIIGVDIGGTNMRIGVVGLDGKLLAMHIHSSRLLLSGGRPAETLIELIQKIASEAGTLTLKAISVGVPSLVRCDGLAAMSSPNLQALDGVDLVTPLRKTFFCPVYLNKDANLLLCYTLGQEPEPQKTVAGVYYGTGIGSAVWVNGGLVRGKNGMAGELGHIPFWGVQEQCACGNRGCAEAVASGKRLEQLCRQYFSQLQIGQVFQAAWPCRELERYVDAMACVAAVEVNIFDPDLLVLGGGVVYMPGFPREYLTDCIRCHTRRPLPAEGLNIRFASQGQATGILGAAYYALQAIQQK